MAELNDKTVEAIRALALKAGSPQEASGGNMAYAVVPNDCQVKDLSFLVYNDHASTPERKKAHAKVLDSASFCEYYTLFSDVNSRVFADETKNSILAILDYHGAGTDGGPRWGQHKVELTLRESEEWTTWSEKDGVKFSQIEFAEFVESNASDISNPAAATMLEVARDLSAKGEMDFGSAVRLNSGAVQFKFSQEVKGTFGAGQLEVPEQFTVSIPVYLGGARSNLTARLRYRIASGKLTFWYDLLRADAVERTAFLDERRAIADTLKVNIINGTA